MFLDYKSWVKENYNCVLTGSKQFDQHHLVSVGMGNNRKKDIPEHLTVINLRHDLHSELHRIGLRKFQEKHGINLWEIVVNQILTRSAISTSILNILRFILFSQVYLKTKHALRADYGY